MVTLDGCFLYKTPTGFGWNTFALEVNVGHIPTTDRGCLSWLKGAREYAELKLAEKYPEAHVAFIGSDLPAFKEKTLERSIYKNNPYVISYIAQRKIFKPVNNIRHT
jgi:hypothetical protein